MSASGGEHGGGRRVKRKKARRKSTSGSGSSTGARRRLPRGKRLLLVGGGVVLGALLLANLWAFRRQFPTGVGRSKRSIDRARLALGQGDVQAAVDAAREAVQETPDDRWANYVLALALERAGRSDEARVLLDARIVKDLEDDTGRVLLAAIAQREEDYATALRLLSEATVHEPTPGAAYRLVAEIRTATGDRTGAAEAYRAATTRDSGDLRSWLGFGDLQLAVFLENGSRVAQQDAGDAYRAAERIARSRLSAGTDPIAQLALAKSLAGQTRALRDRTVADAAAAIEAIVAATPDDPQPTLVLAEFHRRFGDLAASRDTLDSALRRWDVPAVRVALSALLVEMGETSDAQAVLARGVEKHPADAALRLALAERHVAAGRPDDADAVLAAAVAELPDRSYRVHELRGDVARERARAAESRGELDAAREIRAAARASYEAALALRPRSMPLRKKRMGELLEGGLAAGERLAAEDRESARAYVEDVLRVNPGDADALAWRSRLLLLDGLAGQAFDLLELAAGGDAPTIDVLRLFGAACERTGRDARAADAYQRVVATLTNRNSPEARDDTGATAADWVNLIRATLRGRQPELGSRFAADAVIAWPRSLDLHLLLAQGRLLLEDTPGALVALARAGAAFPGSPEPRILTAAVLERDGRLPEAEGALRAAVTETPDDEALLALASFLGRTERTTEAAAELTAVLERTSDRARVLLRLGALHVAADPPDFAAARTAYEESAKLASDPAPALARLADVALLVAARDPDDVSALTAADSAVARYVETAPDGRMTGYLRGKLALLRGRADEAVLLLRQHATEGLPSAAGLYYLAKALRAAGRSREAEGPLGEAQRLAPGDPELARELEALRRDIGADALARGEFADAVMALASTRGDGAGPPALLLAGARAGLLEFDLAEQHARDHLVDQADDVVGRHVLAALLVRRGSADRRQEARVIYRGLLESDEGDVHARIGLASLRLHSGEFEAALAEFRTAYDASEGAPGAARGVATCLAALDRIEEARTFLDGAIEQSPDAFDLRLVHGDLLLRTGHPAEAAAAYLRAADARTDDERPVIGRAAALAGADRQDEARQFLQERVGGLTSPHLAWLAMADLAARAGDAEAADALLLQARTGAIETPHGVLLRGQLAESAGNASLARRLYASGVDRGARSPDTLRRLGHLLAAVGEVRLADDTYQRLLRLLPDDLVGLNNRALLLADDPRRRTEALTLAEKARSLDPESAAVADTLGWVLLLDARPQDALEPLREAAAGAPKNARIRYHAGLAAARLALVDEAREHFEAALAADPDFADADAVRAQLERLR